ncbi:MAG: LysR family transcriptional regulator [Paracoccaceae bacterium]|nr:LysR family transcriptional regulator [Paracoccaceae bacterium]
MTKRRMNRSGGLALSRSDLSGLRVFEAVARHHGFTTAQTELGLSQPSISNHIAALETRLGVRLCHRGSAGFELTEKGRMVLASAQRLFSAMDVFSDGVRPSRSDQWR